MSSLCVEDDRLVRERRDAEGDARRLDVVADPEERLGLVGGEHLDSVVVHDRFGPDVFVDGRDLFGGIGHAVTVVVGDLDTGLRGDRVSHAGGRGREAHDRCRVRRELDIAIEVPHECGIGLVDGGFGGTDRDDRVRIGEVALEVHVVEVAAAGTEVELVLVEAPDQVGIGGEEVLDLESFLDARRSDQPEHGQDRHGRQGEDAPASQEVDQ